mgnify:FL=1|tara:strand:- start:600 stop:1904 length:1305 start_codon:yes stop_codon:yes gene_type:complete
MTISKKSRWNWLNGLTNKNKPAGIKKVVKGNMPDWADSYVYKLSSIQLNKTYIGYHKENGKTYFGSTTDTELISLVSDSNSDLVFEIVEFGSMEEMKQVEHEMLTEVDARNNPNYWNKTNGIPGVRKFNRVAINKVVEIVKNGGEEYLQPKVKVSTLSDIPKAQVRDDEYDKDNLSDIIDAINRSGGSTDKAKPPVILEDRIYDGESYKELRIGGAHTIESYCRTKYKDTAELAPIVIPKELHEDITDEGITLLGDLLNTRNEISSPASHKDGTKYLMRLRQAGRSWSPGVKQDLFDMGLSSNSVKTAFENAQALVDNQDMLDAGYVVKDYTGDNNTELEKKVEEIQQHEPDAFVGSSSSAAVMWDRIFYRYDEDKESHHNRIVWVVYHTSKKRQTTHWPKLKAKLLRLNRLYGKSVPLAFEEMPLYVKEVSKN